MNHIGSNTDSSEDSDKSLLILIVSRGFSLFGFPVPLCAVVGGSEMARFLWVNAEASQRITEEMYWFNLLRSKCPCWGGNQRSENANPLETHSEDLLENDW